MTEIKTKKRDYKIDIIKGIAIILMVAGHAYVKSRSFIYLFHMSVFLISAGYFWKSESITNLKSALSYILKKVKLLFVPYLLCIFIFLTNVFVYFNIYSSNQLITGITKIYPQCVTNYLSLWQMFYEFAKTTLLGKVFQMGSATWFIFYLFIVYVCHTVLVYILKKYRIDVDKFLFIFMIFIVVVGYLIDSNNILLLIIKKYALMHAVFILGYFFQFMKQEIKKINIICVMSSFFLLVILSNIGTIELSAGKIVNPIFYFVASLSGWIMLYGISTIILEKTSLLKKIFIYIGQNTMIILCLHLLSFKIVTLLVVLIKKLPIYYLASFHILFDVPYYVKYLYIIIGVVIPLLIDYSFKSLKQFFLILGTKGKENNYEK